MRPERTAPFADRRLGASRDEVDRSIEALRTELKTMIEGHHRLYLQMFADDKTAVEAALSAQEKAVAKAEGAAEKRFEGVNEFRAQLGDQQRTLMPRAECEIRFKSLSDQVETLSHAMIERRGQRTGIKDGYGYVVGVIGVLLAILTIVLRFIGT